MFKTDFKVLSSVSKTGCTSVFGNLVKAISLPSSPLALSALIWTKQNESKVLLEQALGSEYVRNNNEVIDKTKNCFNRKKCERNNNDKKSNSKNLFF